MKTKSGQTTYFHILHSSSLSSGRKCGKRGSRGGGPFVELPGLGLDQFLERVKLQAYR